MKKTNSIELPVAPKDKEYEECVSAYFQCAGFYVERNLVDRDIEEVLELDIIATKYDYELLPDVNLLEVKSGGWGFPDIFKIRGWMDYLNLLKGILIVKKNSDRYSFYKSKANGLKIELLHIPEIDQQNEEINNFLKMDRIDEIDFHMWRYAYWAERNLLKILNHKKKSEKLKLRYEQLEKYYFTLNSKIFFTDNIVERIEKLYEMYFEFGNISAKCANELTGGQFCSSIEIVSKQIYDETYYKCKFNDLCISSFIEHRARLAILKNAIDYIIYKNLGENEKTQQMISYFGWQISKFETLPSSFKDGIEKISRHKYFYRYPVFWQWFMWIFGGFILVDFIDLEYGILSIKTGIPQEEIDNALSSYQLLFPCKSDSNDWFLDLSNNSSVKILKMFPVAFMGIGANYRRLIYTRSHKFGDLKVNGLHTLRDLKKWNAVTLELLSRKLN